MDKENALKRKKSHYYRRQHGGAWRPVYFGSLVPPYNLLEEKAAEMNPGEVSGPIEAGNHVFIMKLLKGSLKPFREVQWEIKAAIEKRQRNAALNKLRRRLDKFPGIEEFADLCIKECYFRFTGKGLRHVELGSDEKEIDVLKKAIETKPDSAEAYSDR